MGAVPAQVADASMASMHRSLKIVYIINHAAFFVSHRLPIAVEARRRGNIVALLTGQAGSDSMERVAEQVLALEGIPHTRVAFTNSGVNPLVELRGLVQLVTALQGIRPHLVHCASPKGILYGALAARLARVPALVVAVSGMGFAFTSTPHSSVLRRVVAGIYRRLARVSYGHPNKRVIVQNHDDFRLIVESGLARRDEVVRIPGSGVDLTRLAHVLIAEKRPIVLFPARMLVDKGVLEFAEAARILRPRVPDWRFLMAGAADYRSPAAVPHERLEQFQADGAIEWLGHVGDMTALYQQASIVCLPSYYREGIPKSLLEAAAAGCAVVTADTTGCREAIIAGVTGELVPPRDAATLAATLFALISDRERRERYGSAGRKRAVDEFGIDAIVDRIVGLYDELASNG